MRHVFGLPDKDEKRNENTSQLKLKLNKNEINTGRPMCVVLSAKRH